MEIISVIKKPLYTEKTYSQSFNETKKYTFLVHPNANKILVKQAFKLIYNIEPLKVNIVVRKPVSTRTGTMHPGFKSLKKIAIITTPPGVTLAITGSKKDKEDAENAKKGVK